MAVALYLLNGIASGGFLNFSGLAGGRELLVQLSASLVRMVVALWHARLADSSLPRPIRGWRKAKQLVQIVVSLHPTFIELTEQTVRSYLSKLQQVIRNTARSEGLPAPLLLELSRSFGARLAVDRIEIVESDSAPAGDRSASTCHVAAGQDYLVPGSGER